MPLVSYFPRTRNKPSPYRFSTDQTFFSIIFLLISLLITDISITQAQTWQADFRIRVLSPRANDILFSGNFYQDGLKVRIEPEGSEEIYLYDFERFTETRVFPNDRIYFETSLSHAKILKAYKEGWIHPPFSFKESRTLLRRGKVDEKDGRLYFIAYENENKKIYSLRWVTADRVERPLRIIYQGSAGETVIVNYEPLGKMKVPGDYFEPPADYLSLNPF